jgi:4-amino-4-deoxy-L-arabinose transferase-like glycosyltransferase
VNKKSLLPNDRRFQFIILFAVAFSIIPILFEKVLPYDMLENLYWGKEWQLGYDKHPPLFGWISYSFFRLCGSIPDSLFFLTQLNLLLGCFFVFKISRLIEHDADRSLAAVLFFLCSGASVLGNTKFNATTILCSLLPMLSYFCIRLMKFRKATDAILLGLVAMLTCISKYIALLYLGVMFLFLVTDRDCRSLLKTPLPYITICVFAVSISWHVWWIFDSDFATLRYAMEKSIAGCSHRIESLKFLAMLALFFGTSFWALKCSTKECFFMKKYSSLSVEARLIFHVTFTPIILLFSLSLIFGMQIGSYWGASMGMLLGVWFCILNKNINYDSLFKFTKRIFVFFAITMMLMMCGTKNFSQWDLSKQNEIISRTANNEEKIKAESKLVHDAYLLADVSKIAKIIENKKQQILGDKKIAVLHASKEAVFLHAYLKDSPSFYNAEKNCSFGMYDFKKPGIHLIARMMIERSDKENPVEIEYLREAQTSNTRLIASGRVFVIENVYVYYAFVEADLPK